METLHIPVALQKLQKCDSSSSNSSERQRVHFGTTYFPEGTSANDVCVYISEKQRKSTGGSGLWLLQMRAGDHVDNGGMEQYSDDDYTTIKDSKHLLQDGNHYVALHYTGPDIFLIKP